MVQEADLKNCQEARDSWRDASKQLQKSLTRANKLLREIYGMHGPRRGSELVPARAFAKMTRQQVDQWDFPLRHQMQRIAKALSD